MQILQDSWPPALGPEMQLPGQDYEPEAGATAAPAAPLPPGVTGARPRCPSRKVSVACCVPAICSMHQYTALQPTSDLMFKATGGVQVPLWWGRKRVKDSANLSQVS